MIRVLIVDDEPVIRRELELLITTDKNFVVVGACGSIAEAKTLIPTTRPDLLFLDIQLNDGIAFDLLQSLKEIPFHIIFITSYNEFAIKAIKYGALDYLLKPINEGELRESLQKVKGNRHSEHQLQRGLDVASSYMNNLESASRGNIVLRSQYYIQVVAWDEIIYCRSDMGYTHFHLANKTKMVVSKPIKEYDELLPHHIFLRPHQSYLVNRNFIYRFHKEGYLILKEGEEIPVSTRKKEHVIAFLTGN